jgi:hypothetical protein
MEPGRCVHHFSAAGIRGITAWRNVLEGLSLKDAKQMLADNGMDVVSLARGGFFPAVEKEKGRLPLMIIFGQ